MRISIYSPISFGDMSTPVSKKNITEFNSQIFSEDETELNNTFNSNGFISFLPCGKFKKLDNRYKNKCMCDMEGCSICKNNICLIPL